MYIVKQGQNSMLFYKIKPLKFVIPSETLMNFFFLFFF